MARALVAVDADGLASHGVSRLPFYADQALSGKPEAALAGTMLPLGGAKGASLAMIVEILAATLTGSNHGFEASSFFSAERPPPKVGQLFLLLDPSRFAEGSFTARLELLIRAILKQPGTRLPGDRRLERRAHAHAHGIELGDTLYAEQVRRAGG